MLPTQGREWIAYSEAGREEIAYFRYSSKEKKIVMPLLIELKKNIKNTINRNKELYTADL